MIALALSLALIPVLKGPLSLDDAERIAVNHSVEIRLARNSAISAWAQAGVVSARTQPQLGVAGTAQRFDDVTTVGFAGTSLEVLGDHTEQAALQLVQVIDITNVLGTAHAQARLAAMADEFAIRSRISDQILSTKIAFMNVLRSVQGVKVAQTSLRAYREQLRMATELWKAGTGQRIDVYRATSQVANAEKELLQRQNDLNMSRCVLNDQIGIPLNAETELIDIPEPSPDSGLEPHPVADALAIVATKQRSEARSAALGVSAAEKGIRIARSSTDPTVALSLAGSYFPTTSFSYPRQSMGVLTLSVNIPILDGGETRNKVEDARATLDSAKSQEQQVRRAISLQVQNAVFGVETARKSLLATDISLKAAVAARDLARTRFENQVGLYLEVTDAQAALTLAEAARVNAAYDVLIAEAQLQRATGDLAVPVRENTKP